MGSEVAEKDPSGRFLRYEDRDETAGGLMKPYRAFDQRDGVEVAWFRLSFFDRLDLFQVSCEEIDLLKSLKHKNVARFHEYWIDEIDMKINLITESCASGSLREYRRKHEKIHSKVIKNWGSQVLKGIHYLHSLDPPVILGDLACDKLFVNGNNGQVKIAADLAILTSNNLQSEVVQRNQLQDVYCFGLCMLEILTGECQNSRHMCSPASLGRVVDPQAKNFIEKCLSMSYSAIQLLYDTFLAPTNEPCKEIVASTSPSETQCPEVKKTVNRSLQVGSSKKNRYELRGIKVDEKKITFHLRIIDKASGASNKIEFPYYVDSDTSVSVAKEMIEQLGFSSEDVAVNVRLIDASLMELAGCTNTNSTEQKRFRLQNKSTASPKQKGKESREASQYESGRSRKTMENHELTLSNNRNEELKVQLDAINVGYAESFEQILKNISII